MRAFEAFDSCQANPADEPHPVGDDVSVVMLVALGALPVAICFIEAKLGSGAYGEIVARLPLYRVVVDAGDTRLTRVPEPNPSVEGGLRPLRPIAQGPERIPPFLRQLAIGSPRQ